ncbi:g5958 [Coccomyxa viridis]|uniref:G5958 protein n=1 Tax=Coccomyxa viridis TaxID=1274662 RepID=A0ABP1FU76_9CHLO
MSGRVLLRWIAPHGSDYIYFESPQVQQGLRWTYAHNLHAQRDSLLANTMQHIYDPAAGYALYNDERPNGTVSFHLAHAKGVLGFDASGGFWLLHSSPRYSSSPSQGEYTGICCGDDGGQLVEGQSSLCMSLAVGAVNQVARQLMIPSLFFYDWGLPACP